MSNNQPSLESTRYILRPFTADDAPAVQLLAAEKRISDMVSNIPHPYPEGAALQWISTHVPGWEKGVQASFAIVDKTNHELCGAIGLSIDTTETDVREAEIGYWLGVDYWGRGILKEVMPTIVDFAFSDLGLHRIEGFVENNNEKCKAAMAKVNFQL